MIEVKDKIRTVTFLSREQIDFLDKLGKDVLFSQGFKLSRVDILSSLVDLLMALKINLKKMDLKKHALMDEILTQINPALACKSGVNHHYIEEKNFEEKKIDAQVMPV